MQAAFRWIFAHDYGLSYSSASCILLHRLVDNGYVFVFTKAASDNFWLIVRLNFPAQLKALTKSRQSTSPRGAWYTA